MSAVLDIKIPVWLYRVLAIFPMTGIAGFDHYAVGSTQTAFAKGLVNLLTFGSWYIYDILQSLDAEKVSEKGLKFPFYEGGAIGAGRLAVSMEGLGTGGETLLNVLFTSAAAMLAGLAMLFEHRPPPVGSVAKTAKVVFGGATVALGGYTAYTAAKGVAKDAAKSFIPSIPGFPAAMPGAMPGAMPAAMPGAMPGASAVPSIGALARMVGGGAAAMGTESPIGATVTADFIALGLLFLLAASGFTLSALRPKY